ncbi:MAG: 5'-methylthioadenosine/S-adenosylhomocysteine nucleosidase [Clostridia bacterium]|nr:5'-methylthioadenosine/S-adenosylhomocysteine nucleosidase [Clostridia bacterium]
MKKIGLIAAMNGELNALLEKTGELKEITDRYGKKILYTEYGDKEIYLSESGVGEILAAGAAQRLISAYGVEAIINFGVCGSLKPRHSLKKTVIVKGVAHYEFDTSALDGCEAGKYDFLPSVIIPTDEDLIRAALSINPSLEQVICASGNKFVEDKNFKSYLRETFNADVCEMEAAGIALTCHANGVPCLMVKAVSDGEGGAAEFEATVYEASRVYTDLVMNLIKIL